MDTRGRAQTSPGHEEGHYHPREQGPKRVRRVSAASPETRTRVNRAKAVSADATATPCPIANGAR
jgi:hypothetical protein